MSLKCDVFINRLLQAIIEYRAALAHASRVEAEEGGGGGRSSLHMNLPPSASHTLELRVPLLVSNVRGASSCEAEEENTKNKQKLHSVSACLLLPLSISLFPLSPLLSLLLPLSASWSSALALLHAQINSRLQLLLLLSAWQALQGKEELKGEGRCSAARYFE